MDGWFFRITEYTDELLDCLDKLKEGWPQRVLLMQKNWIGKSQGAEIDFPLEPSIGKISSLGVYTTRPDTLYGVTYMCIAPEHPLVAKLIDGKESENEAAEFIKRIKKQSSLERISEGANKEGVFTGSYCINPLTDEKVPIYIANFVLMEYGTGIIMCVPAHDQRDFEFAKKYKIPLKFVISQDGSKIDADKASSAHTEDGILFDSGKFSGMSNRESIEPIAKWMEKNKFGKRTLQYKLRDWLISRQRYWGAPIPIVYCETCGTVPVPEEDLPVLLPDDIDLAKSIGSESSPLADSESFVNVDCPKCGLKGRREVDTMDTFVDSSWYFLRYTNPHYSEGAWESALVNEWLPVDQYVGGQDHATMHLFYARFVCMALYDNKLLNFEEPFTNLFHQGVITKDGAKMSKSRGNVVSPDPFIDDYGSDTFRMYLMFMGPYDEGGDWNDTGILGIRRFLNRVWRLCKGETDMKITEDPDKEMSTVLHQTIKEVSKDLQDMRFNTAISRIMEYVNALYKAERVGKDLLESLILVLAPFAPHLSEELWESFGHKRSVFEQKWPEWDEKVAKSQTVSVAVQIMGKLRGSFEIESGVTDDVLVDRALELPNIKKHMEGKSLLKSIVIKNKLVNFVIK